MEDKTTNYNFNKPNPIANPNDPFDLKKFISDNLDLIDELFKKKADLIGGKLPTSQLTLDNTPTEDSNNPISSGGAKTALDKKQNSEDAFSGDFNDLEHIPKSFTPSAHTHSFDSIDNKPESYPPSEHTHDKSEINDFPTSMTPIPHKESHKTGGSDALTSKDIGAAETLSGTATIKTSDWTGSSAPYACSITTNGVLVEDKPHIGCVLSHSDRDADKLIQEGWYKAVSAGAMATANKITLYADEKPKVSIPIQWEVVR